MVNHPHEACELCTRMCILIHGQRDPSPTVFSFFKVMIDRHFSKVLYFPSRFARLVSHLTNQETELEDSTGQRWRVGICNHNGSLAIQQGWRTFSSEHGLKMGDFLVFHYVQCQHFVVQIYGTTGCEKINFYNGTRTGKKRLRTNSTATSHDELSPGTDRKLRKNSNSTPSVTAVPVSERSGHQPVITTFASNIDADTGERPIVPQDHRGLISGTSLKSAENGVKGKKTRVDKREQKEMAAKTRCPSKKLNGKEPKVTEKDGQGYPEPETGNNKAIRSEPADSGDTSFPDAGNFSCLLRVDGRNFLELPQSWPQFVGSRKKMGKITIYLKGPDNRPRPVIYHEDFGSKVLTGNWASFTEVYGLKPGDECLFQLSNEAERMFTVQVTHKVDVTQTTLS
ncbi:B3 domain-containing protein Os11g0197600-like [Solanum dulcamara]|uniref:B3 domain-containing protein Os11g0197600-like n=1 Tax=Solanum dulcamara TaxID=45834 RepID=UPI002485FA7E|nr:B3 domain-containing protein Os11g0197600-like [Solanum dulcamara]XP_055825159.1 B3 domain-containing protein Os11g0197600-like [Solanum dulcamara]XP_055825160.1 B3 domain-containing protein Os11g0197600-like [Solanum dulcamara]XP_055825161.1 B3 domain-containing protein Os11g0197600-like [Solanum dulcamara]XP_055825162.1 B3 domain-containing protein Os11g0197600-like [Solanum dulcamara]XP_055825163.1 B3 domain-containing protein Os11g0197600-like [Solanum dulcamara]XP_055825164.1 B3 domai